MARVTDQDLREVVIAIPGLATSKFIIAASATVDAAKAKATLLGRTMDESGWRSVELFFAAYLYVHKDPQYTSRSTAGASGSLQAMDYLETAMNIDTTGALRMLIKRKQVQAVWLGKPPSQQINYEDRD